MGRGFRREPTLYRLTFEDDLEGLEVVAKAIPLGDFLEINELALTVGTDAPAKEQVKSSELLFKRFAEKLVSWNLLDEEGVPVPADYAGIKSQELPLVQTVIKAWMEAIASVPKSSKTTSNGTGTFPEVHIPMALSSASLPS